MTKNASIRMTIEFFERIQTAAKIQSLSVSDYIRDAVEQVLQNAEHDIEQRSTDIEREAFRTLQTQLETKDEQIDHLQQLLAVSQKSIQQLAEQNHLLLEDTRKRTWWKRIFRR